MDEQTFHLNDAFTNDDAVIVIRAVDKRVGVALSLETNGDVEIFFKPADLNRFISALERFAEAIN